MQKQFLINSKGIDISSYSLLETEKLIKEKLAQKSGIDRKTINRIENLLFSPSMDTFFRICGALGVKPNDVIKKAVNK